MVAVTMSEGMQEDEEPRSLVGGFWPEVKGPSVDGSGDVMELAPGKTASVLVEA